MIATYSQKSTLYWNFTQHTKESIYHLKELQWYTCITLNTQDILQSTTLIKLRCRGNGSSHLQRTQPWVSKCKCLVEPVGALSPSMAWRMPPKATAWQAAASTLALSQVSPKMLEEQTESVWKGLAAFLTGSIAMLWRQAYSWMKISAKLQKVTESFKLWVKLPTVDGIGPGTLTSSRTICAPPLMPSEGYKVFKIDFPDYSLLA